jgi:hypothetical protein
MKGLIGLTLVAMLTAAVPVSARPGWSDPAIDHRQEQLAYRIERSWRSGELSAPEYRRLRAELRDIQREEGHLASDGRVSPRDRDHLQARLDLLARNIEVQRRDWDRRYGSYNGPAYPDRRY